jgi:hypothetical protein
MTREQSSLSINLFCEVKLGYQNGESTYYLAYRVPLHFQTQFDQSFAQEVVNSCVSLKEPKVDRELNRVNISQTDIIKGKKPTVVPFP